MLLVNSHKWLRRRYQAENIIKEPIIEDLRAGRSRKYHENNSVFWISEINVYDVAKYSASEQSNESSSTPARKSHSKERTARIPAVIERTQTLISEDPGQSLRKLASIVGISEPTIHRIAEEDLRYKSYTLKIRWSKTGSQTISICFVVQGILLIAQI